MSEILVKAPARVNIIGEHTDYNGGFVLPTTTALFTRVVALPRADRTVEVWSSHFNESQSFSLDNIRPGENVSWVEYVKGVAAELLADGVELQGAMLKIDSDIPVGGGLSSSASLELGVAQAMLAIAGQSIAPEHLAQICQRAEHRYAGVQCGIMDQYTIACAQIDNAVFLDCRSLEAAHVRIPDAARFIIADSGVRHRLPDGDYNDRANECATAVRHLAKALPGLTSLRDLDAATLEAQKDVLDDVLYRRCRHVVSENDRVHLAVAALEVEDLETLGELLNACHASLRDDFEVSCDELETLVEIANSCPGVKGSRMVGAGFGGCILSLTTADDAHETARLIASNYNMAFGSDPWMHIVQAADPVREISTQ